MPLDITTKSSVSALPRGVRGSVFLKAINRADDNEMIHGAYDNYSWHLLWIQEFVYVEGAIHSECLIANSIHIIYLSLSLCAYAHTVAHFIATID